MKEKGERQREIEVEKVKKKFNRGENNGEKST
jgi:hypothetical protein